MKKLIPLLLVAGAAAGYALYKLKKENEKKIIELDEELLLDDEDEDEIKIFDLSDKIEEALEESEVTEASEPVEETQEPVVESVEVIEEETTSEEATAEEVVEEVTSESAEVKTEDEYDEVFVNLKKKDILVMKNNAQARLELYASEGDDLEVDRPIYHQIVFQNEDDANGFRNEVVNKGYVLSKGDVEGEYIVLHILPLHLVKVMAHVYYLADSAIKYNGTYIDWQTTRKG